MRKWPYQGEGHRLCQISQNDSDIMNLCAKQVSSTVQNITLVLNPAIFYKTGDLKRVARFTPPPARFTPVARFTPPYPNGASGMMNTYLIDY